DDISVRPRPGHEAGIARHESAYAGRDFIELSGGNGSGGHDAHYNSRVPQRKHYARMSQQSQFRLLGQRRFLPFFGAQAFGAFNDNVYKNVLVIVATYHATEYTRLEPELLTNIAAGLFILPYVLFSGVAGQ